MHVFHTAEALNTWASQQKRQGHRIGLVPTMGFLHRGHASLMHTLRGDVDRLVVSIYVNPKQFGAGEDLDRYPRDLEGDLATCRAAGVDAVLAPATLYGPDFATTVQVSGITNQLCGASRPTHFSGVTTVVARLFGLSRCDVAIFGEKDWQQLVVIQRMVADLALPVEVRGGALIRDEDGVALSSRNAYLSASSRVRAQSLHRALFAMRQACAEGTLSAERLIALGRSHLDVDALDYLALVDAWRLTPIEQVDRPARALVAAHVGGTRLIDNVGLGPAAPHPTSEAPPWT